MMSSSGYAIITNIRSKCEHIVQCINFFLCRILYSRIQSVRHRLISKEERFLQLIGPDTRETREIW